MKTLRLFGLAALATMVLSCENNLFDKSETVTNNPISEDGEELVLKEAGADNALETADYEVDYFTTSDIPQDAGLKSTNHRRFGLRYLVGQAPDVTVDTSATGFPKTIILDYGEGTELENGKILSGKIVIVVSAPRFTDGATREVTFVDFYVDSIGIVGKNTCSFYSGQDSIQGTFVYNRNLQFNFPDDSYILREGERTRTWIYGLNTPFMHADDEIHITGQSTSEDRHGNVYTRVITNALVKTGACRFIIQGTVELSKNGEVMYLDYGDGECDYLAELTKGAVTKEINLARWNRKRK